MKILGIETSCDETSAAIAEANLGDKTVKILSNIVVSSLVLHSRTGGIVPEIAAREQVKYIIPVIKEALRIPHSGNRSSALQNGMHPESPTAIRDSGRVHYCSLARMTEETIDAIAVTIGPGLIGSLLVGVETAKTLAYVWNKPIIPVNHLIGHIYANFINTDPKLNVRRYTLNPTIEFPALVLIVSGGHTDLVLLKNHRQIKWLGGTRDDAAGEAFDKIGRLLGLPYPGGPSIEKYAKNGNPKAYNFPRPMIDSNDFDFSFSGLKTSVLNLINKNGWKLNNSRIVILGNEATPESPIKMKDSGQARMTKINNKLIYDLAASVQQAIVDVLVTKTLKAAQKYKVRSILLGGGVAANQKLREHFLFKIENLKLKIPLSVPPKNLCTDNAAMIASAAFFNYKPIHWSKITANPELYFD